MRNQSTFYLEALILGLIIFIFSCSLNVANNDAQKLDSIDTIRKTVKIAMNPVDSIEGKKIYELKCMVCHQPEGIGVEGIFPTLANSDYLLSDKQRALKNVIHGFKDTVVVNGTVYNKHRMPVLELTDQQLKDVMNYILNSWGNNGGLVTNEDINNAKK